MAGPTVKEILIKWGIDISDWKTAFAQMTMMLDQANQSNKKAMDDALSSLQEEQEDVQKVVTALKLETEELKKQVDLLEDRNRTETNAKENADARLAAEKALAAEAAAQVREQQALQAVQKTLQAEINTKLMGEKLVTAELNKQSAALRLQMTQQKATMLGKPREAAGGRGGRGGGGESKGLGGGFIEGLTGGFGSKFAGTMAFGVAAGEMLKDVIEKLLDDIKELIVESDRFTNVWRTFSQLATNMGQDPTRVIEGLKTATHGLISETQLATEANRLMMQNIPLTAKQITDLTGSVADLARVQGKDATAAMQELARGLSSGRASMVAYQLGLETSIRDQLAFTHELPASTRALVEYGIVADAVAAKLEETGKPIETLGSAIRRLNVTWSDFLEKMVIKIGDTEGAKEFEAALNEMSDAMEKNHGLLDSLASAFGKVLGIIADGIRVYSALKDALVAVWQAGAACLGIFTQLGGLIPGVSGKVGSLLSPLADLKEELQALAEALKLITKWMEDDKKKSEDLASGNLIQWVKDLAAQWKDAYDAISKYGEEQGKVQEGGEFVIPTPKAPSVEDARRLGESPMASTAQRRLQENEEDMKDFQFKLKMLKEETEVRKLEGERQLNDTKAQIEMEKELYSELYKSGAVTFENFIAEQRDARTRETAAEIENLEKQKKAQQALYAFEQKQLDVAIERQQIRVSESQKAMKAAPEGGKREEAAGQVKVDEGALANLLEAKRKEGVGAEKIELEFDNKIRQARQKLAQDLVKLNFQLFSDAVDAYKSTITGMEKLDKNYLDNRKMEVENSFKLAEMSASEYLDARVELIDAEYEAEVKAAEQIAAVTEDKQKARVDLENKIADSTMKRERELTQLYTQEWDIRAKAAEGAFARVQTLLEEQQKYAQTITPGDPLAGLGQQQGVLKSLIVLEGQRLAFEQQQLETTKAGTTQWFAVQGNIVKSQQALVQYNLELIKAQDYISVLAKRVKDISTVAALFPKGARTAEAFGKGGQFLETSQALINDFMTRISTQRAQKAGAVAKPVTPEEIFASLKVVADRTGQDLKSVGQAYADAAKQTDLLAEAMQKSQEDFRTTLPAAIMQTVQAFQKLNTTLTTPQPGKGFAGGAGAGRPMISGGATAEMPEGTPSESEMQDLDMSARAQQGGVSLTQMPDALGAIAPAALETASAFDKVLQALNKFSGGMVGTMLGKEGLLGAFQNLGKNTKESAKDMGNFMSGVQAVAGMVGGVMQTFKTVGAGQGAIQGAMSFGQVGSQIAGPIGGAIGAAIGAITGAISGAMREATQKMAERMAAAFKAVLDEVQTGTQTLGAGIQLEIQNIQDAVTQLSGRKGGRDQLKQILPDMEAQLQQLQAQQKGIIKSMDDQLNTLNAPQAYQQQLQSIDSIIQKYTQYIQAGGSVVNANQFLQDSFRNLAISGIQQLNQDEQDAINNALQYNDLLLQRQNLIQDTNQQIQDIMSQGVAVRQMPAGVTKARQIQALMRGAAEQLDTLNQEISVSNYKLQNEQKIFGLATTRIGLENQLIVLQNEQTDVQMQQVMALGNVVGSLQTALPTSMPAALQQLGLGAGYVSPGTEPGLAPVPPVKTGIATIDLQNQLQYQQALAAWQLSQNIPIGYIPPTGIVPTTTVPTTIGTPTPYTGGTLGATIPTQTWLTPSTTSLLGTAAVGATSMINTTAAINALPGSVMGALTVNNQQIDTVATTAGTALLVSPATSLSGTPTKPTAPTITALPAPTAPTTTAPAPTRGWPSVGNLPTMTAPPPGSAENPFQGVGGIAKAVPISTPAMAMVAQALSAQQTQVNGLVSAAAQRHTIEAGISSLSNVRVAQETQLVSLKMKEIQADMQRVQAHAALLQASKSGGAVPNTLEDLMQNVYTTRARQGFGGFNGETNNAF